MSLRITPHDQGGFTSYHSWVLGVDVPLPIPTKHPVGQVRGGPGFTAQLQLQGHVTTDVPPVEVPPAGIIVPLALNNSVLVVLANESVPENAKTAKIIIFTFPPKLRNLN